MFGREGSNIKIIENNEIIDESYDDNYTGTFGAIYQQYLPIKQFDGVTPIVGSWVIDSEPAGIGIREDDKRITTIGGRFVPHFIEG